MKTTENVASKVKASIVKRHKAIIEEEDKTALREVLAKVKNAIKTRQ
ncbi:MAG: hypothetical protein PHQ33_04960 [Bacteroidales bacterium]|nr:hypothetical protein [Bacteroidales bacterium]